jgi:hypothetical protein
MRSQAAAVAAAAERRSCMRAHGRAILPPQHPPCAPHAPSMAPAPAASPRADAEMARLVCVKHFKAFPNRSMVYPPQPQVFADVLSSGLVFAK